MITLIRGIDYRRIVRVLLAFLLAQSAFSPLVFADVYRPGLLQARYYCANSSTPDFTTNFATMQSTNLDYTTNCFMCGFSGTSWHTNALTGSAWRWADTTTFGYEGEIYLESGKTYTVWGQFDDGCAASINGTMVFSQGTSSGYNDPKSPGTYAASSSGWYAFRGYVWDWGGGKNIMDGIWALQWNTNNINYDFDNASIWHEFSDIGAMSFLKHATSESFLDIDSLTTNGSAQTATVKIVVDSPPADAWVYVFYGDENGGMNSNLWDHISTAGPVATNGTTATHEVTFSTAGYTEPWMCVYLRSGNGTALQNVFEEWGGSVLCSPNPAFSVEVESPGYTNGIFSITLQSMGVGASSYNVYVEISENEDISSPVVTTTIATSETESPKTFSSLNIGDLDTNRLYYVRVSVTNDLDNFAYALTNFTTLESTYDVTDFSQLVTVRLKVGDKVKLPDLDSTNDSYVVLNSRVVSLSADGVTLTALSPGGSCIERQHVGVTGTTTNNGAAIVVPEPIGSGKVYLFREVRSSNYTTNWNTNTTWECLTGAGTYPSNVDDVAMILLYTNTSIALNIGTIGTPTNYLGELYAGQLSNMSAAIRLQGAPGGTGALNFAHSTTNPAVFSLTGGGNEGRALTFRIGPDSDANYKLTINVISNTLMDAAYGGPSDAWQRNEIQWRYCTVNIPENRYLRIDNATPYSTVNQSSRCWFDSRCIIAGYGTFWHNSAFAINMYADLSGLYGALRDTGYGHYWYDRNANIQLRHTEGDRPTYAASNATAEICGFPGPNLSPETMGGVGFIATGINHGYGSPASNPGNRLTKHLVLEGGTFYYRSEETTGWAGSITNHCATMTAGRGMSVMWSTTRSTNGSAYPLNTFDTDTLIQTNRGTVFWNDIRCKDGDTANIRTTISNFNSVAIGTAGDARSSTKYPVIPWVVCRTDNNYPYIPRFAAVDGNNMLCKPNTTQPASFAAAASDDNVYLYDKSLALAADKSVNSLTIRNDTDESRLGSGRTLTITSGGLILGRNGSSVGVAGDATSGSLMFSNTAYVWSGVASYETTTIAAEITATNDLVKSGTGQLILTGDQTGIDGEIVVNYGTLHLGTLNGAVKAQIDADIRIVSQGSTVQVNVPGTLDNVDVFFDDVHGFGGKLILPAGKTERCTGLYIGDLTTLVPCGTYGATGSGADFIDDVHFSGTGILDFGDQGSVFNFR